MAPSFMFMFILLGTEYCGGYRTAAVSSSQCVRSRR